ncbi:MAG: response regulator [Deltaproteobacteria bacterium]|nr:MAG: response regulator [Deltaproteobacteria bacterium]
MSQDEPVQILLVDDQPGKLLSYEAMLADLDATLIRASSASEALEQLLRTDIAVVLIDVCMPELDGFELAAMIRGHPRYRNTAIILVSAVLVNDVHRLKGYHAGAMDYVGVPVVPEILRAKVAVFADLYRKSRRLERMNEELERRVEERTAALRASDRRKDEFLAILAHELRNPLAPMLNSIHLLRACAEPTQRARAVEVIDRQLGHLIRLVDDLLDVSRITTGKLELRTESVKIVEALEYAVERVQPEIEHRGQQLSVAVEGDALVVDGDATRLTQIFSNLLQNASKFTERGGKIAVRAERSEGDVLVSVRDTGVGIAPEMLESIYELFSQGDRSLERHQGGLGIGLTIVKRLVELHGGSVVARSDGLGAGSEFAVSLPIPAEIAAAECSAASEAPLPSPQRILLADDNRDSLESLALLLELQGNTVRTAVDGVHAVAEAEAFRPDVVLLDVGMPNMNGYDACRRIRAEEWGRNMLLLALTGWGQEGDRARSHAAGFDQHFVKPIDPKALIAYLGRHAAKRDELRSRRAD